MRALLVVNAQPLVGDGPQLGDRFEEVRVEHLGPIAPIEAFDVRVLIRLARLNVERRHAVLGTPLDKRLRRKLGAVVHTHGGGPSVQRHELVQHAHDATAGQRGPDADLQRLAIPFINHRQQTNPASVVQGVGP